MLVNSRPLIRPRPSPQERTKSGRGVILTTDLNFVVFTSSPPYILNMMRKAKMLLVISNRPGQPQNSMHCTYLQSILRLTARGRNACCFLSPNLCTDIKVLWLYAEFRERVIFAQRLTLRPKWTNCVTVDASVSLTSSRFVRPAWLVSCVGCLSADVFSAN